MVKKLLRLLACLPLIAGCAVAPLANPDLDRQAKTFAAVSDKCSLYVFRRTHVWGAAAGIDIWLGGELAGRLMSQSYYLWQLPPGDYQILSIGENTARYDAACQPGEIVYVEQRTHFGMSGPRTSLRIAAADDAQEAIREGERYESLLVTRR